MRAISALFAMTLALAISLLHASTTAAGERCGPTYCAEGSLCCNDSCGLCAPPGGACIQPYCGWGSDSIGGRRPILALDHPSALLGPRAGVMGGWGGNDQFSGGQVRAAGNLPLGKQFRVRGALDLSLATFTAVVLDAASTANGRDGAAQSELGIAWSVPTSLTWLQAAVMLDGVVLHRRTFHSAATTGTERSWGMADLELAPGLALAVQRWSVAVAAFVRAGRQLACQGVDCDGPAPRLWEMGASLDTDGRNLGIPFGLLLHGRTAVHGNDLGAGAFWLGHSLRVGLELRVNQAQRSFLSRANFPATWPAAEWNLRVDWLPSED